MLTFVKDGGIKTVSKDSALITVLLEQGWKELKKTEKKELKNAISSATNS